MLFESALTMNQMNIVIKYDALFGT